MAQTRDLTKGKPLGLILNFFFPMLLTNMLQQIYTVADTAIVGKGLGDNSLAAVGNMSSLTFFIIGFAVGLTNGFSVIIGQAYGANDKEKLRKSVASAITLACIITVILTTISVVFLRTTLEILQTSDIIMNESLLYGYIIFGGLAATIFYNLCAGILRALGDSKTPFIAILVSSITNIVLNCVAIFYFHSGVEGPAIVTVVSQIISTSICYSRIRKIEMLKLYKEDFKDNSIIYSLLLRNSIPMAIMNSITAIGCMVVQYFVNGMGVIYTSAYSACSKYINLFMQPACTAGHAMIAFTSQNYGARKYSRILDGLRVCLSIAAISYITLGTLMFAFPEWLASLMLNGEEQIMLTAGFLRRCGIMIFMVDCLFVVRSACQGMGKPFMPMVSGILEMVLRITVIVTLTGTLGFMATAYAEIAAWIGALAINLVSFIVFYRQCQMED